MEQKDYILREIEKIGLMLRMLVEEIKRMKSTDTEVFEQQVEEQLDQVAEGMGFELEKSLTLSETEFESYLMNLAGYSISNLELLADLLFAHGTGNAGPQRSDCLRSALRIYEASRRLDKTFSLEREEKIREIRSLLS
jgi:hypothetical protein